MHHSPQHAEFQHAVRVDLAISVTMTLAAAGALVLLSSLGLRVGAALLGVVGLVLSLWHLRRLVQPAA